MGLCGAVGDGRGGIVGVVHLGLGELVTGPVWALLSGRGWPQGAHQRGGATRSIAAGDVRAAAGLGNSNFYLSIFFRLSK